MPLGVDRVFQSFWNAATKLSDDGMTGEVMCHVHRGAYSREPKRTPGTVEDLGPSRKDPASPHA